MGKLEFLKYPVKAAKHPGDSPLFDAGALKDSHSSHKRSNDMPDDVQINPGLGKPVSILPYTVQDDYDREKEQSSFEVASLENERLRATFVPRLGGRLWSLYDKKEKKELLHKNPVFQPANLALRNAWFSGGIEWNISIIGHTPFTCAPLFTTKLDMGELGQGLRMYEYERLRGAVYCMDFFLPKGSDFLFAHTRIINTNKHSVPMYWWTNMAVDEREDVRVIVPADKALHLSYEKGLCFRDIPIVDGADASYTTNLKRAMDFFYYIEPDDRKYIAAIGEDGRGFVQSSTAQLKGRKLFMWGTSAGGERWQEYLAQKGSAYLEIQAGLGYSQMEYLEMPSLSTYEWTESFGPMRTDAGKAHGPWDEAVEAVSSSLETALPMHKLYEMHEKAKKYNKAQGSIVMYGSGWGALEIKFSEKENLAVFPEGPLFDDTSLEDEQKPWLSLLRDGVYLDESWPRFAPKGYQIAPHWRKMLEESIEKGKGNSAAYFVLGVIYYNERKLDEAKTAFEKSDELISSAWAKRALALLEYRYGDKEKAFELYPQACIQSPSEKALAIEFGRFCVESKNFELFLEIIAKCDELVNNHPRVQLLKAKCFIELERLEQGAAILLGGLCVPDIREGEVSTTELWYRLKEKEISVARGIEEGPELSDIVRAEFPPPRELDFRMS